MSGCFIQQDITPLPLERYISLPAVSLPGLRMKAKYTTTGKERHIRRWKQKNRFDALEVGLPSTPDTITIRTLGSS